MIRGLAVETRGTTDEQRARSFVARHPALFGGNGSTLALQDVQATHTRRVVRFQHRYRGLPVFGATVAVVLDQGSRVRAVSSEMEPITKLASVQPRLTAAEAVRAVQRKLKLPAGQRADGSWAQLGVLPGSGGTARLIYRVALPLTMDRWIRWHLVEASSGEYVGWRRATCEVRR
jgi:pseudolysin/vibriolysin